ncbi:MAG: hypothetical protein ACK5LT_07515 [Lachnospirales bacterium]
MLNTLSYSTTIYADDVRNSDGITRLADAETVVEFEVIYIPYYILKVV